MYWKRKVASYLCALPWQGLGQKVTAAGLPEELETRLSFSEELFKEALLAVEMAKGMMIEGLSWEAFYQQPQIKHPLSGRTDARQVTNEEGAKLGQAMIAAVQELCVRYQSQQQVRQLYLALWRQLPAMVRQRVGELADWFPAFAAMPDRNMWQQAQMAAAYASTYEEEFAQFRPALFQFNLGSVQEFVFTARRTQDFWLGSYFHSYVIWKVIQPLAEEIGPDAVLYPDLHQQPLVDLWLEQAGVLEGHNDWKPRLIAGFPNVFTLLVSQSRGARIGERVEAALAAVREEIFSGVAAYIDRVLQEEKQLHQKLETTAKEEVRQLTERTDMVEQLANLQSGTQWSRSWQAIWQRQKEKFLLEDGFWVLVPWVQGEQEDVCQGLWQLQEQLLPPFRGEESQTERHRQVAEYIKKQRNSQAWAGLLYQNAGVLSGRMLSARKNLRYFTQSKEPGCKCSLCGTRQALTVEREVSSSSERMLRVLWRLLSQVEGVNGQLRGNEQLCAVCMVKRFAYAGYLCQQIGDLEGKGLFPSVASVATADCKEGLLLASAEEPELAKVLKEYVQAAQRFLKKYGLYRPSVSMPRLEALAKQHHQSDRELQQDFLRLDGGWLYEESWQEEAIKRELSVSSQTKDWQDDILPVQKSLRVLLQSMKNYNQQKERIVTIPLPSKYYAVLYLDGDEMGQWVQGRRSPLLKQILHEKVTLPDRLARLPRPMDIVVQSGISTALKNFSQILVPHVVEGECCAKLVYAGGDDVMALAPLGTCLNLIDKVRKAFNGRHGGDKGGWQFFNGERLMLMDEVKLPGLPGEPSQGLAASASAGVVVAHYTQPLQGVLANVAKVLKVAAKEELGRDAFAVLVDKRGGEPLLAGAKWQLGQLDMAKAVDELTAYWRRGLSPAIIYKMQQESAGLAVIGSDEKDALARNCQQLEGKLGRLGWLLRQHGKELGEADKQDVTELLMQLLQALEEGAVGTGWDQLVNLLLLSRFIGRGGEDTCHSL